MCTNVILVRILVGKSCARSPKVAGMKKALKHKVSRLRVVEISGIEPLTS